MERNVKTYLFLLVIFQVVFIGIFGVFKEGYHGDEIFSYGLSNSYEMPFLEFSNETWDRTALHDYLTVQTGEGFSYGSVWYNQSQDVHPPLYYALLHTVCSFSPDVFSKYSGLLINLLLLPLITVVLFLISKSLLKNDFLAFGVCVFYGLSNGAVTNALFVRMYVMATLLVLCCALWHIKAVQGSDRTVFHYIMLCALTVTGALTHYYFLIFALFSGIFYCIYGLCKRKYSEVIKYIITMAAAAALSLLIFPYMFDHIFYGYQGQTAFDNIFFLTDYMKRIMGMCIHLVRQLLGGPVGIVILAGMFIIMPLYAALKHKVCRIVVAPEMWYLLTATVGYMMIVAKIGIYRIARFFFPVYPAVAVIAVWLLWQIWGMCAARKNQFRIVLALCLLLPLGTFMCRVDTLYQENGRNRELLLQSEVKSCLYVSNEADRGIYGKVGNLTVFDEIFYITYDRIKNLSYETDQMPKSVILYCAPGDLDGEMMAEEVAAYLSAEKCVYLCEEDGADIYYMMLED